MQTGKAGRQNLAKSADRRLNRNAVEVNLQQLRDLLRIFETFRRGVARRHHDATHPVGPECVHRNRSGERGIHAARQSDHDARETVLVHIVFEPQHHGAIEGFILVLNLRQLAGRAEP